jgi:hypothetical protein
MFSDKHLRYVVFIPQHATVNDVESIEETISWMMLLPRADGNPWK